MFAKFLADFALIRPHETTMRTIAVIFAFGLITIAFEVYSDAVLTSDHVSRAPDTAAVAVIRALKRG